MKVSELTGAALDWAVCLIENPQACEYGVADWIEQRRRTVKDGEYLYRWHQSWMQAGPIIEREEIGIFKYSSGSEWTARTTDYPPKYVKGPTPLIAAMRCFVSSRLGDEIEVPEELK